MINPQLARARDGRWMALVISYPSQQRKAMKLLNCGPDFEQVRSAMARRESAELEEAGEAVQVPLHVVRTKEEWAATEQGRIHAETPLIHIEKIGDSDPIPLPQGERPLSGLKVPLVRARRRRPLRGPDPRHAGRRVHEPEHARLGRVRELLLHSPGRPAAGLSRRARGRES